MLEEERGEERIEERREERGEERREERGEERRENESLLEWIDRQLKEAEERKKLREQ